MTKAATIDLEERRTYIGASEAAAALGLSPWGGPVSLAEEKWGEAPVKESTFRMRLGTLIEPVIGDLYRQEHPDRLIRAGGSKTRRMKGHPWIGAHPDFIVYGDQEWSKTGRSGLVQAKLSNDFDDGIPVHYELQGHAELAVTGAPWIDFAVLEDRSFRVFRLERDQAAIDDLVADLDDFWHGYIVPKIVPPPSAADTDALRRRYPRAAEKIGKLASDAQAEKLAALARVKADAKALKEQEDLIANEIRAMIGSAHYIEGDGYRATWSRFESTRVAWEEVAKAYRIALDEAISLARSQAMHDDPAGWARLDMIEGTSSAIESLYTRTEPGHRLTVSTPKEK